MFVVPPVFELSVVGILDPGVPNLERVVLRPTQSLNLAGFALVLSKRGDQNGVSPLPDRFFWFGERWITPPSWIVVFTGPGAFRETLHEATGEPVLELHWGQTSVVLNQPDVAVSLLRIGAMSSFTPTPSPQVPPPPPMLRPQGQGR